MRAVFTIVVIGALLILAGLLQFLVSDERPRDPGTLPNATIDGTPVRLSVARTQEEQRVGLSGRTTIAFNEGLLFVFEKDDVYGIWMRDMLFPIDILWLSEDGVIVDMKENVSPETYPEVFTPQVPARYVVEVTAGFSEAYNVDIGDSVDW